MSSFPGSPKLIKGGLVLIDPISGQVVRIITLQYNPDTLMRSLQIKGAGQETPDHTEALRLKGPPAETIKLEAEVDATDRMEGGQGKLGLHAELAALEVIVYPTSSHLAANNALAQSGTLEIAPAQSALTLLVLGRKRIVPVRITELSITEEAFDIELNPIRAKISLGMRVLSVDDLGFNNKGGDLFMTYLKVKEQLSAAAPAGTFAVLGVNGIS